MVFVSRKIFSCCNSGFLFLFINRYAYLSRRCITPTECQEMNSLRRVSKMEDMHTWRPFNGSCVTQCPEGYEDYIDEKNVRSCPHI